MLDAVDVPVIASVNATSSGSWIHYAALLADAGASAIELNVYEVAADASRSGAQLEADHIALVTDVCASVDVPVAVKLSAYYSSLGHLARSFADAGAAGLVCFNRFYQPDLDIDTREVVPRVELSSPWELRLPLRWIAILRPLVPDLSLAASSGIDSGRDVAKALLVGADVAMTTSAVLRHGPEHIAQMEAELRAWAAEHEYDSVAAAAWQREPRHDGRSRGVRAGELRAHPSLLGVMGRRFVHDSPSGDERGLYANDRRAVSGTRERLEPGIEHSDRQSGVVHDLRRPHGEHAPTGPVCQLIVVDLERHDCAHGRGRHLRAG